MICDMGMSDMLVGRSSACDYPESVKTIPVVGDFGRPNWERIIRINPDVVVATDLERPAMLKRLKSAGIHVLLLPCENWQALLDAARSISQVAGRSESGEDWISNMQARRDALRERVHNFYAGRPRPRVYAEVWGNPLTTPSGSTFISDLITLAGGMNIAETLDGKYVHVSAEWVVRQDPDVILLAYMLGSADAAVAVKSRVGWSALRAVRNDAICSSIPPDHLLRPGPRMLDGAKAFAEWLMQRRRDGGVVE
jgi:iron complex transport system substrate-binding protein